MPSFRLTLCYDGTDFAGSQVQRGMRTVQGELNAAIRGLGEGEAATTFAGRTDRGVHAAGQVAAFSLPGWRAGGERLGVALNAMLPRDLGVVASAECGECFSPRYDAVWREYRYWIAPGAVDPFLRRTCFTPRADVDETAINAGASLLLGTWDFASFAGGGEGVPWSERSRRPRGTVRTVLCCACRRVELTQGPGLVASQSAIEIRVAADGFLPRMVRNIVGALVEIGQGRRSHEWIADVLDARDRRFGSVLAPPQGLTLWRVGYGDDALETW